MSAEVKLATDIATIIAAGAAGGGLIFTGYSLNRSRKVDQLQLTSDIFEKLLALQHSISTISTDNEVARKAWRDQFFTSLEWLSFLINEKHIKDEKMIGFFKDALLDWNDKIFSKRSTEEEMKNKKYYPEFKKLVNKLKKSKGESGPYSID